MKKGKEFQDRIALKQVHVSNYSKSWVIDYDIDEMNCLEINEEKYNIEFEKIGKFKAMKLYTNYRNKRYRHCEKRWDMMKQDEKVNV